MLVLTRKLGEKVVIDQNITLTILEVTGGKVKLGIDAPPEVSILRSELVRERQELTPDRRPTAAVVGLLESSEKNRSAEAVTEEQQALSRTPSFQGMAWDPLRTLRQIPR